MFLKNKTRFAPFSSMTEKSEGALSRKTRNFFSETVDVTRLVRQKSPQADLRIKHRKVFELSLILTLVLMISMFQLGRLYSLEPAEIERVEVTIEVADIPQTEQVRNMPSPPARPSIPIPTESEEIPADITIESTELNLELAELPPPPPPKEEIGERYVFVPYDEPPFPIRGYVAIQANLKYPEIAKKAGIEAQVVVGILIDEQGHALKTQILKSSNTVMGFEEAAAGAVMRTKWKPAKQRDHAVKVWVAIPIRFQLRNIEKKQVS